MPASPRFEHSLAIFDAGAKLLDWNAGFAVEFEHAAALLAKGVTSAAILEASLAPKRTLDLGWTATGSPPAEFQYFHAQHRISVRQEVTLGSCVIRTATALHDVAAAQKSSEAVDPISDLLRSSALKMSTSVLQRRAAEDDALRVARAMAEAASLAKSEFLANMSHEIRTPMNAIIGLSSLALKSDLSPRIADYLLKIKQSGDHLLGIINDILDFSKIEAGKLDIERVPFDLQSVIDNVVNLLSEKVGEKGLELLCSFDPCLPKNLIGDPLRIGQILINFANNAVKFTYRGEIRLSVVQKACSGTGTELHFSVADTGIGITQEQMGRLFQSFEQADASITRRYGGTGLGLAISKRLAEAMGGQAGVESVLGKGSTFWFTAKLGIGSPEKLLPKSFIDLHGRRTLVVDDNDSAAIILCDLLSAVGFSVHSVNSGPAALEEIKRGEATGLPYEFVLVDWLMPSMNGLETVQSLHRLALKTRPFVIMLSAHRHEELVTSAKKLGVEHVLAKPVSGSLLVNTMMQVLGHGADSANAQRSLQQSPLEARLHAVYGARVLLVEDNEINQLVAGEMLRDNGLLVDIAQNGKVAQDMVAAANAEHQLYDMVLMDMQMPVMDGITATLLLRETYTSEMLPVVAMTANAMQADRDRCMAIGMNGFVTKPINPDSLWQALLDNIKPQNHTDAPAKVPALAPPNAPLNQAISECIVALKKVPDIDVEAGLSRVNGNGALYTQLFRKFARSQHDALHRVQQAIDNGDRSTAERVAHTLKGVTGNLGATAVQEASHLLEKALEDNDEPDVIGVEIRRTANALEALLTALTLIPGLLEPASAASTEIDITPEGKARALGVLSQVKQLLDLGDAQALSLWQEQRHTLEGFIKDASQIESALESFEFDEARALLEKIQT